MRAAILVLIFAALLGCEKQEERLVRPAKVKPYQIEKTIEDPRVAAEACLDSLNTWALFHRLHEGKRRDLENETSPGAAQLKAMDLKESAEGMEIWIKARDDDRKRLETAVANLPECGHWIPALDAYRKAVEGLIKEDARLVSQQMYDNPAIRELRRLDQLGIEDVIDEFGAK